MRHPTHVIKSEGKRPSEDYHRDKLHASIVAACMSVHSTISQAESTAHAVTDNVESWLENKPEVTSSDIRNIASQFLHTYNPDAAYIYKNNQNTI